MERLSGKEETQGAAGERTLTCECRMAKKSRISRIVSAGWKWIARPTQSEIADEPKKHDFHNFTSAHFERGA